MIWEAINKSQIVLLMWDNHRLTSYNQDMSWLSSEWKEWRETTEECGESCFMCTLAGAAHTECLSISLFGKLQSSTKLIRSTDPDVETDNLQLKLAGTRLSDKHLHSFLFLHIRACSAMTRPGINSKKTCLLLFKAVLWSSIHWKWLKTLILNYVLHCFVSEQWRYSWPQ